jgi:hypothetical protein
MNFNRTAPPGKERDRVTRSTKASSAGSIQGSGRLRARIRRAFATRGASLPADGTSAPAHPRTHSALVVAALALTLTLATAALLALTAAPASAALKHPFLTSLDATATPTGSFSGSLCGVNVDPESQDVYVADPGNGAVDLFNSSGTYQSTVSGAGTPGEFTGSYACTTALDEANGNLYVADSGPVNVKVFDSSGNYLTTLNGSDTPAESFGGGYVHVAVDQASGDIYVSETGHAVVDRFNSAGVYQSQLTGFSKPWGLATDASGDLYVSDQNEGTVTEYDSSANQLAQIDGSETPVGSFGEISAVAVDSTGHLYVSDSGQKVVDEFDASGNYVGQTTGTSSGLFSSPQGVAVNAAGELYVADRGSPGAVDVFGPAVVVPDATTGEASELTPTTATVSGIVNPDETEASYQFEYGETEAYGEKAPASPAAVGNDNIDHEESVGLAGLQPSTVYHFRIDGINPQGTNAGADQTLRTTGPPTIDGSSTSGVTGAAATIEAQINPSGFVTTYKVEYGTSESYGSETAETDIGSANEDQTTSNELSGLKASTTYHYRILATNSQSPVGGTRGPDQEFTTEPAASIEEQSASAITRTCATLEAQVNPDGTDTSVFFEYGTTSSYGSETTPADIGSENEAQPASAEVCGLVVGTEYHFRAVATNSQGTVKGLDRTFTTVAALAIDSTSAANVTASSADLRAQINPLGEDTEYRFEYGTDTTYGTSAPIPDADIGSAISDQSVSQQITGLTSDTTYHFRVVAHNAEGTVIGSDHTFVYDTSGGGLPDGRAYEMVTPPDKGGAVVGSESHTIAADGSSLAGFSSEAFAGITNGELAPSAAAIYRFGRTASGWATTPLTSDALGGVSIGVDDSLWHPAQQGTGVDHLFLGNANGAKTDIGPVWPSVLGPQPTSHYSVVGAASDASQGVLFTISDQSLLWPFDESILAQGTSSLYEYTGTGNAAPTLVGVSGAAGSTTLISQCGTVLGSPAFLGSMYNAISQSGQTVFFTALGANNHNCAGAQPPVDELFARIGGLQTVAISEPSSADCSTCNTATPADALFEGASADGSKVFFTTTQQLTNSDTDTSRDLYSYDFNAPAGQRLVQLSGGGNGDPTPGSGAQVEGVSRISEDGSHVYYVAGGVLTTDPNGEGQSARAGADNLYVSEPDPANLGQLSTAFVALLCSGPATSGAVADSQCPASLNSDPWTLGSNHNDQGLWSHGADGGDSSRPAQVTPDGRLLLFTSYGDLTAGDTSQARQIFRYDSQSGQLTRVSIGESGFNDNGNTAIGDASIVAPQYGAGALRGGEVARTMSDDGSYVFFESPGALTPQALDHVVIDSRGDLAQNVYEYHEGHVSLVSDGRDTSIVHGGSGVHLIGTDASGGDVFFTTVDPLVPQDTDTQVDIYDARIGGGFPQTTPPPPCIGETCKPPASQPLVGPSPGSAALVGPGNEKHHHKRKHHHKKRHHKRAANHNRGGAQ